MATILVVDNHVASRQFLCSLLEYSGHRVLQASDGAEGLEKLETEPADVVITDILTPTMDGFEMVRRIRKIQGLDKTRVIFLTAAYLRNEAQALARACGVEQIIFKPPEREKVLEVIGSVLQAIEKGKPKPAPQEFTPEHLRLLTVELAERVSDLHGARMQLQALFDFSQSMAAEQEDARRQLKILCDTARQLVGARFAASGLVEDGSRFLNPHMCAGVDAETHGRCPPPPLDHGVLARILAEGKMVSVADIGEDPVAAGLPPPHLQKRAFLGFPIRAHGRTRAILWVIEKLGESEFNSENERILLEVANHAAVCFENVRRYEEIQRHAEKLEREMAQRRMAEEALGKSEAKYRGLLEAAPDAMVIVNQAGEIILLNLQAEKQFGYRRDELLGQKVKNIIPEGFAERLLTHGTGSGDDPIVQQMGTGLELYGRRKDGNDFPIEIMLSPLDSAEGILVTAAIRDISVRKAAEEHLVQMEAQYRQLFENAHYGIYRATVDGRLLQVNRALVAMLGYETEEELLGKNMSHDIYSEVGVRSRMVEEVGTTGGQLLGTEVQWKRKDGKQITVRVSGRAVRDAHGSMQAVDVIAEDISVRLDLEKQNRGLQKFEAIGKLAGGIAHDFNNVLGAVLGWADVGMKRSAADSVVHGYFQKIAKQAQRAAGLTRQLLAFARRQILEPRHLDLNNQIKETIVLLEKILGAHIEIQTALASDLWVTLADPTQMEQVLMNLLVNARDAMPTGGRTRIETQNVVLDENFCRTHIWAKPGRYLCLSVSDTGVGMDTATLEHIFEPFFTTKQVGEGTGLGLATVYGIVRQHNGFIHVYSEPGSGTMFRIYLPAIPGIPEDAARKEDEIVKGGSETILLVEDHEDLREIGQAALEQLGYEVLTAANGEEAVHVFEEHHQRIALVVLDVIMPKLTGPEAYAKMCQIQPSGVLAMFSTGYSEELAILGPLRERNIEILQKPYSPDTLALKVRQVLDRVAKR